MATVRVFIDGGSFGNPGPAKIGGVFYIEKNKIKEFKKNIGYATNNEAEYLALITALEKLKNLKTKLQKQNLSLEKIYIYSDSRLLINQVNGIFKVKNEKIRQFIFKIRILEKEINLPIFYFFIERQKNKEADRLATMKNFKSNHHPEKFLV